MGRMYVEGRRGSGKVTSILLLMSLFLCGVLASALIFRTGRHGPPGPAAPALETSAGAAPAGTARMAAPESGGSVEQGESSLTADAGAGADDQIATSRRNAIVQAAQKASPAVVTVGVIQTRLVRGQRRPVDPFDLFFNRYLPGVIYEQKIPGIGSGFIVDPSGIVLTNEHVVRDASEIKIILSDGRTFPARLLGADPNYDLAVLKVEAEGLPTVDVGDSDALMVGEWAIAIGNPFGFYLNDRQPTVTVGVISAIHRDVKSDEEAEAVYKDMLQTDAAINPGNSGGPLLNSLGQVIGINTFIFTQGGGSLGIGFAIPINTAVRAAHEIVRYGHARPVWIGIYADPISPWIAEKLGLRDTNGILITQIEAGSPADRAGMQQLDVIREVNGKAVSSAQSAGRTIFGAQVGDIVTFTIERKGTTMKIPVRVEAVPTEQR